MGVGFNMVTQKAKSGPGGCLCMRSSFLVILVCMLALVGCIGTPDDAPATGPSEDETPDRVAPEEWKGQLSEPVFDAVESSVVYLEAEDGTQLSLTLHLPQGLEPDATVPTLLQITPYQSGRESNPVEGTQGPFSAWEDFVLRGAAYVEADARGSNGSEGCLDFGGSKDRSDARVFTDWIRSQDWSNDEIVTDGVSHPGMGSIVAHAADADLTAGLAHAPVVSYYQDQWLQGARLEQINEFYQTVELQPALYTDPNALSAQAAPCTGETLTQFGQVEGPFTDLWADRDLSRHAGDAQAPLLLTHGFVDLNVHPDHTQLYWDALPDGFPKHMILGWWYHGWPDMDGHPAETFEDIRHRWLDATLFEEDNGLWDEPRVLVEDSKGTWHESDDWPLEPSEHVRWNATPDGALAPVPSDEGEASYMDRNGAERGSWDDAHVAFRTQPLEEARLVNGAPSVNLVASSDEAETKWVAYLVDEAPDGSWEWISHGYADSHAWGPEDEWREMETGTAYAWAIQLMPTAVVVDEGHRVTLVIASQDSSNTNGATDEAHCWDDHRGGCYNPTGIVPAETAGRATNTVHLGPGGTNVTLDWTDPDVTQKVPWS